MKKYIYSLFLLFISSVIILTGCVKTVTNIDLPSSKPKLVVGCFLSPQDSLISVTITHTNPIIGSSSNTYNNLTVSDAKVIISDGSNSVIIPHDSGDAYQLSASLFPILSGKTYYLNVSTPRGENISANCTVPYSNISAISVDYIDTAATSDEKKINITWDDIPNVTNYYQVLVFMSFSDTMNNSHIYSYSPGVLNNDIGNDGGKLTSRINIYGSSYMGKANYHIYVLNMDAGYYKYQYSLEHYSGNDPFSEPSPIYTNIKNGLGIFAAYQKYYKAVP